MRQRIKELREEMDEKKCTKCGETKSISNFNFDKTNDRYRSHCKECINKFQKNYRNNTKDKIKERDRIYGLKNKKKKTEYEKNRYNNSIDMKEKKKKYRLEHIEERRAYGRNHYQNNKGYYLKRNNLKQRNFCFIKLFDNFLSSDVEIVWHHINDVVVIPVPKSIHISNLGLDHREKMAIAVEDLYGLDVVNLLEN